MAVASEPTSEPVTREAFIEDVLHSIESPPDGLKPQQVRDRLLADMLYHLMSAETLISQVTEKIQTGGLGGLLGGLLSGKGGK